MSEVKALIRRRQEGFIATRTEIESWVDRLFKQLKDLKVPDIENAPAGRTAREIFPSLYSEVFSKEAYDKELSDFMVWYSKLKEYGDTINRKAEEALARSAR